MLKQVVRIVSVSGLKYEEIRPYYLTFQHLKVARIQQLALKKKYIHMLFRSPVLTLKRTQGVILNKAYNLILLKEKIAVRSENYRKITDTFCWQSFVMIHPMVRRSSSVP
jgi:hypothetical protein